MRIRLDRPEIIDRDDLEIGAAGFHDKAQHIAPDAAKSVDRHSHGHEGLLIGAGLSGSIDSIRPALSTRSWVAPGELAGPASRNEY